MDSSKSAIRVVIVDDHPIVRYGLRLMLEEDNVMTVLADTDNTEALFDIVHQSEPDVVLLDLELGDQNTKGTEILNRLRQTAPDIRVIIYTAHDDDKYVLEVAALGIDGYLLKGCPPDELLAAVRTVHSGGTVLDPGVASLLMQQMSRQKRSNDQPQEDKLSKREIQVLDCLAQGKSNRAIAGRLHICEATVKYHVHAILNKLHASNRTEAVMLGVRKGLIELHSNT